MFIISLSDQHSVYRINSVMPSDIPHFVTTSKIETLIMNSHTDFGIGELCAAPLDHRNIFKPSSRLV
jgi:hypothetical protein